MLAEVREPESKSLVARLLNLMSPCTAMRGLLDPASARTLPPQLKLNPDLLDSPPAQFKLTSELPDGLRAELKLNPELPATLPAQFQSIPEPQGSLPSQFSAAALEIDAAALTAEHARGLHLATRVAIAQNLARRANESRLEAESGVYRALLEVNRFVQNAEDAGRAARQPPSRTPRRASAALRDRQISQGERSPIIQLGRQHGGAR